MVEKIAVTIEPGKELIIFYRSRGVEMFRRPGEGMGSVGVCICPGCGYKTPHRLGVLCREEKCPKCGLLLIREGSYHDKLRKNTKGGD